MLVVLFDFKFCFKVLTLFLKGVTQGDYTPIEDSEETSQSLQIDLGPLQPDQQTTTSSQDGQGKGDDVIVIDSDDEEEDDDENDGEHEVNLVFLNYGIKFLHLLMYQLENSNSQYYRLYFSIMISSES